MMSWIRELDSRDRVLAALGWLHVGIFAAALVGMLVDERTLLGVSVWLKPAKFAVSIAVYAWTLAWLMPYVTGPAGAKSLVRWGTAAAMVVEIACIAGQAARGRTSHFNEATPLDGAIFSIMGLFILVNVVLEVIFLWLFFARAGTLPRAYLWGIRLGLVSAILGGGIGGMMVARQAHTVGAPDGGPGLPIANWSTQAGDLRAPHALALHGLQILPLAGFALSRITTRQSSWQVRSLFAVAAVYAAMTLATLWMALEARPLVARPALASTAEPRS